MYKFIVFGFLALLHLSLIAQKDPQAWKVEKSLEKQYAALKESSVLRNGYVTLQEPQLDEFHKSILDTVKKLKNTLKEINSSQSGVQLEVSSLTTQLADAQAQLDSSLTQKDELVTLGIAMDKNSFPTVAYTIIIICALMGAFAFFLYVRSNAITKETEKRNQELLEAIKTQKAVSLERESKLARELQTERNKNYAAK